VIRQLTPNMFVPSIYAIPLDRLRRRGIRGLIVDLDNTVVPWDEREPSPALQAWVDDVKRAGFGLCLLSNNLTVRVEHFAAALGVPGIPHAGKPRRRAFRRAMAVLGTSERETAVIGDQVFTDVLGGNRLHLYTILVAPVAARELWTTRLVRRVERLLVPPSGGDGPASQVPS
jgi:HAD superfamily phosphatase (TIGR01668 family)